MPDKTVVIVRQWPQKDGGGWIAIFPEIPSDPNGFYPLSYEKVGQHGGCSVNISTRTRPATQAQVNEALAELERVGYTDLVLHHRITSKHLEKCRSEAKKARS